MFAGERQLRAPETTKLLSVNAKQLEQPDFQSDPSRCKSGHGCFKCGVASAECGMKGALNLRARSENPALRNPNSALDMLSRCN